MLRAIADGANTFGKLRKRLNIDDREIRSVIRFLRKTRAIVKPTPQRYAVDA